jgi:hypothetical protein
MAVTSRMPNTNSFGFGANFGQPGLGGRCPFLAWAISNQAFTMAFERMPAVHIAEVVQNQHVPRSPGEKLLMSMVYITQYRILLIAEFLTIADQ